MKVQIAILNKTEKYLIFEDIQEWDNGLCETPSEVYKVAQKEYGRCTSKMYIDTKDGKAKHIGWVFKKKCYYEDTGESYIQEAWITPLTSYEVKRIYEYALG